MEEEGEEEEEERGREERKGAPQKECHIGLRF